MTAAKVGDPVRRRHRARAPVVAHRGRAARRAGRQGRRAGRDARHGRHPRRRVLPGTVLTDVTPDMDAYREEFFGPVGVVYKAADEDEAVKVANDTSFGLGSYVFTTDPEQAERVAEQDRRRHGLRQRRPRGLARAALRRRQALRHLARDGAAGGRRVRQQEAHPDRRLKEARASSSASSAHRTCADDRHHNRDLGMLRPGRMSANDP